MGQESSTPVDEHTPPESLEARTVEAVAKFIKDGKAKKIVVMVSFQFLSRAPAQRLIRQTGAGLSTGAGIPDFRSPDTGLYANLARLNLPYPEAVFDISYFRNNPAPFYALAHELYPGKFRPTISHSFIRLLSDKGLLLMLFTQNIDCLEREAGVPNPKIVEAHGSFAHQHCIECKTSYPDDLMRDAVRNGDIPHCITPQCNGLIKPDIVFFGEQLPEEFFRHRSLPASADLCIVMGTSLTVQPFASLPGFCSEGVPRLLINNERVGSLGTRADDVLLLGDCDKGVRRLAADLGWLDELEALWHATKPGIDIHEGLQKNERTADEVLEDEINKLTADVENLLKLSDDHTEWLREHLSKKYPIADTTTKNNNENQSGDTGDDMKADEARTHCNQLSEEAKPVYGLSSPVTPDSSQGDQLQHTYPHITRKPSL